MHDNDDLAITIAQLFFEIDKLKRTLPHNMHTSYPLSMNTSNINSIYRGDSSTEINSLKDSHWSFYIKSKKYVAMMTWYSIHKLLIQVRQYIYPTNFQRS